MSKMKKKMNNKNFFNLMLFSFLISYTLANTFHEKYVSDQDEYYTRINLNRNSQSSPNCNVTCIFHSEKLQLLAVIKIENGNSKTIKCFNDKKTSLEVGKYNYCNIKKSIEVSVSCLFGPDNSFKKYTIVKDLFFFNEDKIYSINNKNLKY